jgi:hypothetical protein
MNKRKTNAQTQTGDETKPTCITTTTNQLVKLRNNKFDLLQFFIHLFTWPVASLRISTETNNNGDKTNVTL